MSRVSLRHGFLSCLALLVASAAFSLGVASPAGASRGSASPPSGVYTCEWIAEHPGAALLAGVTCDPVVLSTAIAAGLVTAPERIVTPMSVGCSHVPSSGQVGQGVYAWSGYQYSTRWNWFGYNSPANYTWYVQTSGGSTYTWGNVYDTGSREVNVPANIYHWGAQNHSSTAQYWYVCWNDN